MYKLSLVVVVGCSSQCVGCVACMRLDRTRRLLLLLLREMMSCGDNVTVMMIALKLTTLSGTR